MEDRFLKRLSKKAKKGFRGWPMGTIVFYGPDRDHATKVAVGIILGTDQNADELRDWRSDATDVRTDPRIAREILEFLESHGVLTVALGSAIMGCPHQQGINYEGDWCPAPESRFWHHRDRFSGEIVH